MSEVNFVRSRSRRRIGYRSAPQFGANSGDWEEGAPGFTLATPEGEKVSLYGLTAKNRVVLVLLRGYPGYQCPYCTRQVHDFVENAAKFAEAKVEVLLVYPGPPADLDQRRTSPW